MQQTETISEEEFQASWIEPIEFQQAKYVERQSTMLFHASQHPEFETPVCSIEEMSSLELLCVTKSNRIEVANRSTLQLSVEGSPSTVLTLRQEDSLMSVQVGAEQYYVHSPVMSVLPHSSHMTTGTALLTLPHTAVDQDGLVFLRRDNEQSEWSEVKDDATFTQTGGSVQLTRFSNFLIARLFGRNGPERVCCRTYAPNQARLQSGDRYVTKVLMYLEHDQHKLDLFIGDDVDLDGQKEVQVWKGQSITMIADFSGTEQQAALQLCSQEDVSLQWDGGVAKFEFEIEVPASMPARRHVAYFQPIAEQPDQTRTSRPEDRLPLSYQVVASDLQLDSVNLKQHNQAQAAFATELGTPAEDVDLASLQVLRDVHLPSELLHLLPDGVPPLPEGCRWHFFISKHEKFGKLIAEVIARALQKLGFSVWLSQDFMTPDEDAMRNGIRQSAVVLLVMTSGIFVSGMLVDAGAAHLMLCRRQREIGLLEWNYSLLSRQGRPSLVSTQVANTDMMWNHTDCCV